MQFDLTTSDGWQALATEWRTRRARWIAAVDAFGVYESAAQAEIKAASAHLSEADKEAIHERHGKNAVEKAVDEAIDATDELVSLALENSAPTLAAFRCKLDILGHRDGLSDLDASKSRAAAWERFIADVRRFTGEIPGVDATCPVAAIADRIAKANEVVRHFECKDFDANPQAKAVTYAMDDAHNGLAMMATLERAASVKGALLQVGVAMDSLSVLQEALGSRFELEEAEVLKFPDDAESEVLAAAFSVERRDVRAAERKIERSLHSVAHFLKSLPGGSDNVPISLFMWSGNDPFNSLHADKSVHCGATERSAA